MSLRGPHALKIAIPACLTAIALASTGCETTGGPSFGTAVTIGKPTRAAAVPTPPPTPPRNAGQERAGRNSLGNAFKFLEKGMTEQARKELKKAEDRLGNDFWYNYYMAGALQMEQKQTQANEYFELALRYSPTDGMRSRVRVCQSFLYFSIDQEKRSGQMLDLAVQLDPSNGVAAALRDDLKAADFDLADMPDDEKGRKDRGEGRGREKGKGKDRAKKVGSRDEFVRYFLVQVPD